MKPYPSCGSTSGQANRVYFVRRGLAVHLLLMGGEKGSQRRDIEAAKAMARALNEESGDGG